MKTRTFLGRIERGVADTGIFEMTLATDGEASDGHILSVEGAEIPERMPLLISHENDPTRAAGSITHARKELKSNPKRLKATGHIEMTGPRAEIRQDLAHMIEKGHINAVSVRWSEMEPPIRRIDLPKDHPAHVGDDEDGPARHGYFFPKWRGLEGSIVGVGADHEALVGRQRDATGDAERFWREFAEEAKEQAEKEPNRETTDEETIRALIRDEIASALEEREQCEDPDVPEDLERENSAEEPDEEEEEAATLPAHESFDVGEFLERFSVILAERDERRDKQREEWLKQITTERDARRNESLQKILDHALGRVVK